MGDRLSVVGDRTYLGTQEHPEAVPITDHPSPTTVPYDKAYFDKWYRHPRHRVATVAGLRRKVAMVVGIAEYQLSRRLRSVLDVGCGTGAFLKTFADCGIEDLLGVDGDYVSRDQLLVEPDRFIGHDLARPLDLGRSFDLVISLEVAEHLPEAHAEQFVENLCRHGSAILFSAAVPQQGGRNHVNEQWPSYWAEKFARRGMQALDVIRPIIWNDRDIECWYRQNCIIFADARGLAAHPWLAAAHRAHLFPAVLDIVHPDMFQVATQQRYQLISTMQSLCANGGEYHFSKDPDGNMVIHRVQGSTANDWE